MKTLPFFNEVHRITWLIASHGHFQHLLYEVPTNSILYGVFYGKVHSLTLTKHLSTNFNIKRHYSIY